MWRVSLSLFCLILAACSEVQKLPPTVPIAIEADEYSVYTDLIIARYPDLVINSQTSLTPTLSQTKLDELRRDMPEIDALAIADFQKRNTQKFQLDNAFSLPYKPVLLSQTDFSKIIGRDLRPELLQQAFPGARRYVTFVRAGFNAARTQAVV